MLAVGGFAHAEDRIRIGSKRFTESYILGEILARAAGGEHKPGLGSTGVVLAALKTGAIDAYPEYTGTIAAEIVHLPGDPTLEELNRALAAQGLAASIRLGFNNTY
ncbi:MAG TPA: glycine betaine ABC transporter substrate-binding protein, partial [Burkholderiales bacterium]